MALALLALLAIPAVGTALAGRDTQPQPPTVTETAPGPESEASESTDLPEPSDLAQLPHAPWDTDPVAPADFATAAVASVGTVDSEGPLGCPLILPTSLGGSGYEYSAYDSGSQSNGAYEIVRRDPDNFTQFTVQIWDKPSGELDAFYNDGDPPESFADGSRLFAFGKDRLIEVGGESGCRIALLGLPSNRVPVIEEIMDSLRVIQTDRPEGPEEEARAVPALGDPSTEISFTNLAPTFRASANACTDEPARRSLGLRPWYLITSAEFHDPNGAVFQDDRLELALADDFDRSPTEGLPVRVAIVSPDGAISAALVSPTEEARVSFPRGNRPDADRRPYIHLGVRRRIPRLPWVRCGSDGPPGRHLAAPNRSPIHCTCRPERGSYRPERSPEREARAPTSLSPPRTQSGPCCSGCANRRHPFPCLWVADVHPFEGPTP